jgi:uncharacterized protein (TIGR02246 family)
MSSFHRFSFLVLFAALAPATATPDEAAIRKAVEAYAEALNKRDLKTIAVMWAAAGTHTDRETGERTEGRDAIVAEIEAALKANPNLRLVARVDRVRMIRPDIASIEGQTQIGGTGEEASESTFSAIFVGQDGKWLIDSIEETPVPVPESAAEALGELNWLIGHWVDATDDVRVDTTVRWSDNQAFLLRSFVVQMADGPVQQGTQVIGWDPRSKQIRSWSFNSDGSFGDGTWSRNGDEWLIRSSQTLPDGDATSGTYVLKRVDNNSLSLQLIGHEIEGEPQPATSAITMVRAPDEASPTPPDPAAKPAPATPPVPTAKPTAPSAKPTAPAPSAKPTAPAPPAKPTSPPTVKPKKS